MKKKIVINPWLQRYAVHSPVQTNKQSANFQHILSSTLRYKRKPFNYGNVLIENFYNFKYKSMTFPYLIANMCRDPIIYGIEFQMSPCIDLKPSSLTVVAYNCAVVHSPRQLYQSCLVNDLFSPYPSHITYIRTQTHNHMHKQQLGNGIRL